MIDHSDPAAGGFRDLCGAGVQPRYPSKDMRRFSRALDKSDLIACGLISITLPISA
jgi:hypothetical protein